MSVIKDQSLQKFIENPTPLCESYLQNGVVLIRNLFDQKTTDKPKEDLIRLFDSNAVIEDFDESYQSLWNQRETKAHYSQTQSTKY